MAEHDSDEIISRLRGISSDEKSEIGKMKCRIDDQAKLIMMLKKRNDDYILSNMTLDKHAQDLERQIDQLKDQLEEQEHLQHQIEQLTLTIEQLKVSNQQWINKEQMNSERILFQNEQFNQFQNQISSLKEQIKHFQDLLLSVPSSIFIQKIHFFFFCFRESNENNDQLKKTIE